MNYYDAKINSFVVQTQQPIGDAGDVQHLIDKLSHTQNLPLDECLQRLLPAAVGRVLTQKSNGVADCAERAAQLMGQKRQELIFATICGHELLHLQLREQQRGIRQQASTGGDAFEAAYRNMLLAQILGAIRPGAGFRLRAQLTVDERARLDTANWRGSGGLGRLLVSLEP
jgi:hypothetical protein